MDESKCHMKTVKKIVCFVASPSDVAAERKACEEVAMLLNKCLGDRFGVVLEVRRWETCAHAAIGKDGQDVINNQLKPEEADIFIGIFNKRFGAPTPRAESGTQEEFERAYSRWQIDRQNKFQFYFRKQADGSDADDKEQQQKVEVFKKEVSDRGCLYEEFSSTNDFREKLILGLESDVFDLVGGIEREFLPTNFSSLNLSKVGVNREGADSRILNAIAQCMRTPPYIEWDAPVVHFVGITNEGDGGLALFAKIKLANDGGERAINPISSFEIEKENGQILASGACLGLGTVLRGKEKLIGFYYCVVRDVKEAQCLLERLMQRQKLCLKVRLDFQNQTAGFFSMQKSYYLDAPGNETRTWLSNILPRILTWQMDRSDELSFHQMAQGLRGFIFEDRDTFALEFAMGVSGNIPMICGPESADEYNEFCKKCKKTIEDGKLPIRGAGVSFFIRTSLPMMNESEL